MGEEYESNYDHTRIFGDGDKLCAVFHDFENLQESPAGFGNTEAEALDELANTVRHEANAHIATLERQLADVQEVAELIDYMKAESADFESMVNEKRTDLADAFVGCFCSFDEFYKIIKRAWDKPPSISESPLELIGTLIDERDEAIRDMRRHVADRKRIEEQLAEKDKQLDAVTAERDAIKDGDEWYSDDQGEVAWETVDEAFSGKDIEAGRIVLQKVCGVGWYVFRSDGEITEELHRADSHAKAIRWLENNPTTPNGGSDEQA